MKDSDIYLQVDANKVQNAHISILLYDVNTHELKYYKVIEPTKNGINDYALDLTNIPIGKYDLAVINEDIDTTSGRPVIASKISDTIPLEIVAPLTITTTPRTGLEYNRNVNNGDIVATYTTSDGVSPITVTLVSDTSVSGHANDYQLFSISSGNVVVNDPNGLDAGDYYFKLNAIDDNGDPVGGVNSNTVHITVVKTNTTIAFNDPTMTKKSIANASTSWNETATPTPSQGNLYQSGWRY